MLSSASDARRGAPRIFSTSRAKSKMRTKSTLKLPGPLPIPVVNGGKERDCSSVPTPFDARTPRGRRLQQEGPQQEGPRKRDLGCLTLTVGWKLGATDVWLPTPGPREGKAPPHCPILCLQAGASLSESPAEGMRSLRPLSLTGPCPFPYLLFTESFSTQNPFP